MPEALSQVSSYNQKPPMWQQVRDMLGLDYEAPKGGMANLKESAQFFGDIRNVIGKIMRYGSTER